MDRQTVSVKTWSRFFAEFKSKNPIRETSGSGTGTYKWRRYLDGIDMRFGHPTLAGAQRALAKRARLEYAIHLSEEQPVICPRCKKSTTAKWVSSYDAPGMCKECCEKEFAD